MCEVGSRSKPEAIDVDAEVARLLRVERLILQFPINWYSAPPLLKAGQDHVLTRMYYTKSTANRWGWQRGGAVVMYGQPAESEEIAPEAGRYAARIREWVAATRPLERA